MTPRPDEGWHEAGQDMAGDGHRAAETRGDASDAASDLLRLARLERFLHWLTLASIMAGPAQVAAAFVLRRPELITTGAMTVTYGIATAASRTIAGRGSTGLPVATIIVGLIVVALSTAAVAPYATAALVLLPGMAAIVAIQFAPRARARAFVVICWLASVGVAGIGEGYPVVEGQRAETLVEVFGIALAAALFLFLLWQLWDHVTTLISEKGRLVDELRDELRRRLAAQADLKRHAVERARVTAALGRIDPLGSTEQIASALAREVVITFAVAGAGVAVLTARGALAPVAHHRSAGKDALCHATRSRHRVKALLEAIRHGPIVEGGGDGETLVAAIPMTADEAILGVLFVVAESTTRPTNEWLAAAAELAAMTSAFIAPRVAMERLDRIARRGLEHVIARRAFEPHFQPIVRLRDGIVVGYEALTRFKDGTPPSEQFAAAGRLGLRVELERATLAAAVAASRLLPADAWISVNVSAVVLGRDGFLSPVLAATERDVVLEVTEDVVVSDYQPVRAMLERLRTGVRLAVDDAGAGYAGLNHILELKPHFVKLDRDIVRGIDTDPARQAMVAGMQHFASTAGCELIAEGIETAAERTALERLGVALGQGYLLGRPSPAASVVGHATRRRRGPSARSRDAPPAVSFDDPPNEAADAPTVLVADDNDAVRPLIEKLLRRAGYRTLVAVDGWDAVRISRSHPGRIELLVADVAMPGLDGAELGAALAEERPGISIILLSGHPAEMLVDRLPDDQPAAFIAKPFDARELITTANRLLSRPSMRRGGSAAGPDERQAQVDVSSAILSVPD